MGCQANLCPDCAALVERAQGKTYVTCSLCGMTAEQLTRPRAAAVPFVNRLLLTPLYPLRPSGIVTMLALGAFLTLMSYARFGMGSLFAIVIQYGVYWSYMFYVIRTHSGGSDRLGAPDFRNISDDVVMPLVRGVVGTSFVWAPVVIYVLSSDWSFADIVSLKIFKDPVLWLFAVAGLVYAPMALIAAATDIGVFGMLNPLLIFTFIKRVGRDYFIAVAALCLVVPAEILIGKLGSRLADALDMFFVSRWLSNVVELYPELVMCKILGTVLFVHGYVLDWGGEEQYEEPILFGVEPRGQRKMVAAEPDAEGHPTEAPARPGIRPALAPIDILGGDGGAHGGGHAGPRSGESMMGGAGPGAASDGGARMLDLGLSRAPHVAARPVHSSPIPHGQPALGSFDEISLPPLGAPPPASVRNSMIADPDAFSRGASVVAPAVRDEPIPAVRDEAAPTPAPEESDLSAPAMPLFSGPAGPIKQALAMRDFPDAVTLFNRDPNVLITMLSPEEVFTLAAALAHQKQVPQAITALKRISFSNDPIAPKAMFLLGRLYADARHDYDNAERIYRTLVQKFPDAKESAAARSHLKKLGY